MFPRGPSPGPSGSMPCSNARSAAPACRSSPLAFGGNVFGWTADEATSFSLLDAFVDAGFNLVDTADVYSRWAPGPQRRRVARRSSASGSSRAASATASCSPPRSAWTWATGKVGLAPALHPPGGRRLAAPPADRPHRPVPVARRRPDDAAGGHAGDLRRPDRAPARCARSAPRNYTAPRLAEALRDQRRAGPAALRDACSRCTT